MVQYQMKDNWVQLLTNSHTSHISSCLNKRSHAGAFYSGGSLYYSENHPEHDPSADPLLLEYNAGRDGVRGNRQPCLNNAATCTEGGRGYFELTNNKVSYLFSLYTLLDFCLLSKAHFHTFNNVQHSGIFDNFLWPKLSKFC